MTEPDWENGQLEEILRLEAENEQLRRIFNHLTRYATFWNAVRFAEEHMESLDENVLTDADIAYLRGLPS